MLDIYATSRDYDPIAEVSVAFFKKVQNKIHYAVQGQTAAEVIYNRADTERFAGCGWWRPATARPYVTTASTASGCFAAAVGFRNFINNCKINCAAF